MFVDRQFRPAVRPPRQLTSQLVVPMRLTQVEQLRGDRAALRQQFRELVQMHEPDKAHQVEELLRVYAGMELELLQCYRHHYTGKGGFRISAAATTNPSHGDLNASSQQASTTFSLPKAAIATYLREKLRMRSRTIVHNNNNSSARSNNFNSNSGSCAKGDDVRSPEMPIRIPATSTHYQQPRYVAVRTQPHHC